MIAIPVPLWMADAICTQTDPDAFFVEKGQSPAPAKMVCLNCTVRDECLELAFAVSPEFGIFSGFSARERRNIKKALTPNRGPQEQKISPADIPRIRELADNGYRAEEIAAEFDVSANHVRNVIRKMRQAG